MIGDYAMRWSSDRISSAAAARQPALKEGKD